MIIEPTQDTRLIASIMMHPDLFDRITDDLGSKMTRRDVVEHLNNKLGSTIFLKVLDDNFVVHGIFECEEQSDGSFELHPNMLETGRGRMAYWAAKRIIKMLFDYTDTRCLMGKVPAKYLDVLKFTSLLGFKLTHMVDGEYIKNGIAYDMYYLSMNRKA